MHLNWLAILGGIWAYVYEYVRLRRIPKLELLRKTTTIEPDCVSVILPARNESRHIIACLEGLDQQQITRMEVFLVDDQSQDETAALARAYPARYMNVQVIEGSPLPEGWLGKSWACWQAAARARSEWLLFIDADVRLEPGMLTTLLAYARQEQLDMLGLLPRLVVGSLAERLVLPSFFYLLMGIYPFERMNEPEQPAFVLGQCVLIRRSAYERAGGHAAVRQNIIEDVGLAQNLKAAGYRIAMLSAPDLVHVRMYDGWQALSEGMTKHARAGMGDTGLRAMLVAMRQAFVAWLPLDLLLLAALLRRPPIERRQLAFAGVGLFAGQQWLWSWAVRRYLGLGRMEALLMPVGTLSYFLLAARAMLGLRLGRTMRWKGRELRPLL